jgi:SAM-dependent methyltransferase
MLLREAHRTLRPGGTLRLTTPNRLRYAVPSRRLARLAGLFGWSDDRAHRYEYWPWEIRAVVAREGFAVQAFRYRGRNRYVPWEPFSGGVEILARRP